MTSRQIDFALSALSLGFLFFLFGSKSPATNEHRHARGCNHAAEVTSSVAAVRS